MAVDVDALYTEIATAVNDAELQGTTLRVTALDFDPETPPIPAFTIARCVGEYEKTFGGDLHMTITAHLLLSRVSDESGQKEARKLAGTGLNTIRVAILTHRANGWTNCDDAWVKGFNGPNILQYGDGVQFYALDFTIFAMGS